MARLGSLSYVMTLSGPKIRRNWLQRLFGLGGLSAGPAFPVTYAGPGPVQPCPTTSAPVLGSDGRTYRNACYAQRAGVAVVKQLPHRGMGGIFDPVAAHPWIALLGIAGGIFLGLRKARKR